MYSERPRAAAARFHALDALRACVLFLVVMFHASESFEPGADSWAILDRSPSLTLSVIRHACASFAMELFFLIAGFVGRPLYHRRGAREFVRDRTGRILVPLVLGWLVMYPLGVFLWLLGAAVSGHLAKLGIPPEFSHLPLWQLWLGFFLHMEFLKAFNLTHLWFLHQLLVSPAGDG
jgi:peptidoglycan/LPS O-acetylase OafA/YrhL